MPTLPYPAFARAKILPKDKPFRVYGILGDGYLQESVTTSLIEWILPEDARDFNLDTLDGDRSSLPDLLSRCGNLPFLSDHRVVWVRRAEQLEGLARGGEESSSAKGKTSVSKRFSDALKALPETTTLILSRTPETPDPGARKETPRCINANVDKVIADLGFIIDCTVGAKSAAIAVAAINNEAARRDIPMARGAAEFLMTRVGHNLSQLLSDLEKCALRAGPGEQVTAAIITEMTSRAPQETIFDLMDALGARNGSRALTLLRELLGNGTPPEMLLTMMVRHLRQLLQARAFLDARVPLDANAASNLPPALAEQLPRDSKDNLASVLISQGWRGGRLAQQARNFTPMQLQGALAAALDVDLAMKGIENDGGTPEMLLELFLARMC